MGRLGRRGAKEPGNEGEGLQVHEAKEAAAGVTGVAVALKRSVERMGPTRSARTLLKLASPAPWSPP